MFVGTTAQRPTEPAIGLSDRVFVDSGEALFHQADGIELPVLVAVSAKPLTAVVMIFIGETHGDAVAGEGPEFLDESIIEFTRPFALQERLDFRAAAQELGTVAPAAVGCIGQGDPRRIAAVPRVLGRTNLLDGTFLRSGGRVMTCLLLRLARRRAQPSAWLFQRHARQVRRRPYRRLSSAGYAGGS